MENQETLKAAFDQRVPEVEKEVAASGKLAVPFGLIGTDEEKKRLKGIVNQTSQSETGKKILEDAAEAGYSISFMNTPGAIAFCNPDKKTIFVGSTFPDDMLIGALAHESRHAGQFARGADFDFEHDTVKSQVILARAMEADAEYATCITAWELKEQGNKKVYSIFNSTTPVIAREFEKALRNEDSNPALAAFKAWYKDDMLKGAYEDAYVVAQYTQLKEEDCAGEMKFDTASSAKKITDIICTDKDGKSYFTDDPKTLEEGIYLDIKEDTMAFLKKFMKERKEAHGLESDKSIESIPTRVPEKRYTRPNMPPRRESSLNARRKKTLNEIAKSRTSVMAAKILSKQGR